MSQVFFFVFLFLFLLLCEHRILKGKIMKSIQLENENVVFYSMHYQWASSG